MKTDLGQEAMFSKLPLFSVICWPHSPFCSIKNIIKILHFIFQCVLYNLLKPSFCQGTWDSILFLPFIYIISSSHLPYEKVENGWSSPHYEGKEKEDKPCRNSESVEFIDGLLPMGGNSCLICPPMFWGSASLVIRWMADYLTRMKLTGILFFPKLCGKK